MEPKQTKTESPQTQNGAFGNQQRNGFVVVVVLCMVMLLSVLLLGFNYKSRANLNVVDGLRKSEQALNSARAGLNIAIAIIRDTNDIHTNRTLLDLISGEKTFAVGDGECSVTITEENSRLNVNLLKDKDGKLDRTRTEQLLRLIDLLNREQTGHSHIGYGLVPSIIDWTDSDDQITNLPFIQHENMGAESSYYNRLPIPYSCKNALLDTTEELLLVKGITQEVYERIRDYVTVYGDGKININSASRQVIECLSEKIDAVLAQMIIDRREFKPFDSIMEMRDVPGITDGIYNTIKKTATVGSTDQYYHVISQGNVDHLSRTTVAILERNMETKNVEVVLYKEL
ncbi:MAG: type II secretion system minor pseudopilin GspK [Phycisphaerae bacterium]